MMPTVLDALGLESPPEIKGYPQSPIHGVSFAHTFDDPRAVSRRKTQYYEMFSYRALYQDGWTAVSPHLPFSDPIDEKVLQNLKWELYHTDEDFSQVNDLAETYPEKVREMEQRWWVEAGKYNVLPLDSGRQDRIGNTPKPQLTGPRTRYEYYPNAAPVKSSVAAPTLNRSYAVTAEVEIPEGGAQGVLLAHGGNFGGWSLFIQDGRLHFTYNWQGREYYDVVSAGKLPTGKMTLSYQFEKTGEEKFGAGGIGRLFLNGKPIGEKPIVRTNPNIYWPHGEGLTCGYDDLTTGSPAYKSPFSFTGTIEKVVVDVNP